MQEIDFFTIEIEPITWRNAESTLREIRRQISPVEDQYPDENIADKSDTDAWHWIAYDAKKNPMGSIRLQEDGKIDRLVVLGKFRGKGVGNSLLRKAVEFGLDRALPRIYLHAPAEMTQFFKKMKFVPTGDEWHISNKPYRKMMLDLQRFQRPTARPLAEISESDRQRKMLEGIANLNEASIELLNRAQRQVRIFSQNLYPDIFADRALCEAMLDVCTRHALVEVKILVNDKQDYLRHNHHPLIDLHQQLTSSIQIRRLPAHAHSEHAEYLLVDDKGYLYIQQPAHHIGFIHPYARRETTVLMQEFDTLWGISVPDPNLRQMRL